MRYIQLLAVIMKHILLFITLIIFIYPSCLFGQSDTIRKVENFTSIDEARAVYLSYKENSDLIKIDIPLWNKFEGSFSIKYECPSKIHPCYENVKKAEQLFEKEIQKNYPNETFSLEGMFGYNNSLEIEISCNKSLKDKFNLYPIACCDWSYFKLTLTSFWKSKKHIPPIK